MKSYACEVVPVYVRPQPITDEKACIGVIMRCPEAKFADYRLVDASNPSLERIANFFPRLGREDLLRTIEGSRHDIEYSIAETDNEVAEKRFSNLIRPRENAIQYGAPQIHVTETPSEEIDRIYRLLVA